MFKKCFIPIILIILVIIGFVRINILNTKALSPLGNTEDNFGLVSEAFGEDFQEFIMDKSPIKIYVNDENDDSKNEKLEDSDDLATIKIVNKEINLTKDNMFLRIFEPVFKLMEKSISSIKDNFNKNTENNNKIDSNVESGIDKTVDDFIKNIDNN